MNNLYRVNYFKGGVAVQSNVVAESDNAASYFLGVRDGSAQVNMIAKDVQVVGLDEASEPLIPIPPSKAPVDIPKNVSRQEFNALQQQLNDMQERLKSSGEPTPVQVNQPPKEK